MSSLGDLLQGKVGDQLQSRVGDQYPSSADDVKVKKEVDVGEEHTGHGERGKRDPPSPQSNDDSQQACVQKLFPDRIEKRKIKDEDDRSNASSTDDYVQELLDPNDRPRNVWHVVEGPNDDNGNHLTGDNDAPTNQGKRSYHDRSPDDRSDSPPTSDYPKDTYDTETPVKKLKVEPVNDDNDDLALSHSPKNIDKERQPGLAEGTIRADEDVEHDRKSSSRHRKDEEDGDHRVDPNDREKDERRDKRSASSRHHHHDRHSSRDTGRRHRDKDRHRDDRDKGSHRSSRRRHDYSDDEYDKHDRHGSRSRRHGGGSRSSSRSRRRDRSDSRSPSSRRNSRTVLVMQLHQRVTSRDLEDFFSDIGDVREVRLIMDSKTRRHKGIAYIEFEDTSTAAKALSLDGKKFLGAPLQIQAVSSERLGSGRGDGCPPAGASSSHDHHSHHHSSNHPSSPMLPTTRSNYPSSRSNLPPNSYRIYIGGLHVGITDEMLKTIVEPFGHILRLELIKDRNTGASRGYAFILYATIADGQEAVRCLDGFTLAGKQLRVSKSTEKGERGEQQQH